MANYECAIRTNYFHVKDAEAFKAFMNTVYGEDDIKIFKDDVDEKTFGFCSYGTICGIDNPQNNGDDDDSYGAFLEGLQKLVAEDDAIIILESGNEKLRYVNGLATIITSSEIRTVVLICAAEEAAKEMLHNPDWEMSY